MAYINAKLEISFEEESNIISFEDISVKEICIANWDKNGSRSLSKEEAALVTDIGTVFNGNTSVTSFDELKYFTGISTISSYAFKGCTNLERITFPTSLTSIEEGAFYECRGLSGTLSLPNSLKTIGTNAFFRCTKLTGSLTIPNSVTSIGEGAFYQCKGFSGTLTLPESITSIGAAAFYDCRGLTGSLTIPNTVVTIEEGTFLGCSGFTGSLTIPNSVTSIENDAFRNCTGFTGPLIIPNSVKRINIYAFYGCSNINRVISQIQSPFEISNNVFEGISSDAILQIPHGTKSKYQEFSGWTVNFKEIVEETRNFTLLIKASGNGTATYDGTSIRNKNISFTVNEGTSATITFTPDAGYRIASVKLNGTDVTSSVSNNQYTISDISANTTLAVTFEAITHTLSITSSGNGSVTHNSISVRGKTTQFTVNEGTSATITFTPDAGYHIASVMLNGTDVTSNVANNKYTVSNITANTTLVVTFEAITHTLSITSSGNGSAYFNNTTVRNKTEVFTINEGTSATITFAPDTGYRIATVKVNNTDVTANVSNNLYTISNITANTTLAVTFEVIPPTTYSFTIKATGNGTATYNDSSIRGKSSSFTVNEGTSATVKFTPDTGYKIKSVKLNGTDVTSSVANSQYTISSISANTTLEVEFEAITHTLSITATGNGSATFNSTTVRGKTQTFTVNEGTSPTITFTPDAGYRIATVMVNNTDVTASVANNTYTISNITANTTLAVTFEAIPPTTYSFTIKATGNGTATYNDTSVRDKSSSFTVNEGTSATVKFTPDAGYKIKSVKLNGTDVTSSVANSQYTISSISANTTLEVEFEAITHTLSITATGNGSATFNSTTVRGKTQTFTVNEGTSAAITFVPDAGYRIASVKVNNTDVTTNVSNSQYTISNITANTALSVTFEAIPPTTYSFTIKATGNGSATYNSTAVRGKTQTFTVNEGTTATITFTPDTGYKIKSVKLNNTDVTSSVVNSQYTISNIKSDNTLAVEFEAIPPTTYSLSITVSGNGTATYNSTAVRGKTQMFTVNEGISATVTFAPDSGYRVASVKLNGTDVKASVVDNKYTISNIITNTTLAVTFEAIPPTTYTLSISALGNGYVAYDGNTVRGKTLSFSVEEGSNAVLKFSVDEGNRLKSVKVNGQDVTSTIVNNQYTISNITANATVEVAFEAIPTYSLNIVASGNGSAVYNGTTIRNQSQSFTLREGSSAIVSFTPDAGYRIKNVKVNNADMTSQVANGQITISNIVQDINVEVSFEEIPPTTYSLTITTTGNGAVTYEGHSVRGGSSTFTIVEGSYATVLISADDGYRLKSVTQDGKDVTASVANGQYTTDRMIANTSLEVEFEAIPTFSLAIKSSAFGSVKYGDAVITNQSETFTVREGTSAVLSFVPDGNGRLQRITLNGNDITSQLVNGQYTITDIRADQSVEAEYVEDITKVTDAGVAYTVTSYDEGTVIVAAGNYGQVLTVPASFTAKGKTWTVTGIDDDALTNTTELAAIIWEPEVPFTAQVSNPNLLLYVKRNQYAQSNVQNVVFGNENEGEALQAENIVLMEAESGNNFYCPKAFEAKHISYEHNYSMISGYKDCQGWETLVLPFDVTMAINTKGTELVPYSTWAYGSNLRPFWLYQLTNEGWKAADGIKANVPYIISMPNNEMYESSYNLTGNIQFIGTNVEVKASDTPTTSQYGNKRLVANYQNQPAVSDIYALNVSNDWYQNTATEKEGSTFIRSLRAVHPFEAYLTVEGSAASQRAIAIFDIDIPTGIMEVEMMKDTGNNDWYSIDGRKLQSEPKQQGIYIYKGKKVRK